MKILLIRNDNIGDLICTTPAIEALRKAYKTAQIDIVVNSLNHCAIDKNPHINKIHCYTKPKHKKGIFDKISAFFGKCKMIFEIWREKYDIAVVFRSSYSSSAMLFTKFARASRIVAVPKPNLEPNFITDKITIPSQMHEVFVCYEILSPLGVKFGNESLLFVPKNPSKKYENFVFFHISSRIANNKLSKEKIVQILEFLKQNFTKIAITSEDAKFGEEISKLCEVEFVKTKNLDELANYLCKASFLLCLDGGVCHLGPALGVKTLALFGKTNPSRWAPHKGEVIKSQSGFANDIELNLIKEKIINLTRK